MKLKPSWRTRREMVTLGARGMFVSLWLSSPPDADERALGASYADEVDRRGYPFMLVDPGAKVHPNWIPVVAMMVPDLRAVHARLPYITELPTETIVTNWNFVWIQSGRRPERMDASAVLSLAKRVKDADSDEALQREFLASAQFPPGSILS